MGQPAQVSLAGPVPQCFRSTSLPCSVPVRCKACCSNPVTEIVDQPLHALPLSENQQSHLSAVLGAVAMNFGSINALQFAGFPLPAAQHDGFRKAGMPDALLRLFLFFC